MGALYEPLMRGSLVLCPVFPEPILYGAFGPCMSEKTHTMKNILRAELTADAKAEVLIFRLKRRLEIELIHHFKNESTLLLFVTTRDQYAYERFLKELKLNHDIASIHSWSLSLVSHNLTIPTYEPKTWLL